MPEITSTELEEDFNSLIKKLGLENPEKFSDTSALIIPQNGYPDKENIWYFPSDTSELFAFLEEKQTGNFSVDIYADDENYTELLLHADWIRIAEIVVRDFAAPLLIGLLIEYIARRSKDKADTEVDATVDVVFDKNKKTLKIRYKGSAGEFGKSMSEQIKALSVQTEQAVKANKQARKRKRKK